MQREEKDKKEILRLKTHITKLEMDNKDLKLQLVELKLQISEHQRNSERNINELQRDFQRKEFEYLNNIKDLQRMTSMSTTAFGVHGLLAKKNIEINEELSQNIEKIKNRVIPEMMKQPNKQHVITCYEFECGGKKTFKIARSQRNEIEKFNKFQNQYSAHPNKRLKQSVEKSHGWLRSAEKFLEVPYGNPVTLWVKVREQYPHYFYGFKSMNKTMTVIQLLDEEELREKYRNDVTQLRSAATVGKIPPALITFQALNLQDEEEAVEKCLTLNEDGSGKVRIQTIIQETIDTINKENCPTPEPIRDGSALDGRDVYNFIMNNVSWNTNNTFNILYQPTPSTSKK